VESFAPFAWPESSSWPHWPWPISCRRTPPSRPGWQPGPRGVAGLDAGYYETIARVGYHPLGANRCDSSGRSHSHARAGLGARLHDGAALIVSPTCRLLATVLLSCWCAVRRAMRRWLAGHLRPEPGSCRFVLVMGYAESTLLCLASMFPERPARGTAPTTLRRARCWASLPLSPGHWGAARIGRGRRTRALVDPLGPSTRLVRPGGDGAPVLDWRPRPVGHHEVGDFWPRSGSSSNRHHGGLAIPSSPVFHDVTALSTSCRHRPPRPGVLVALVLL